MTDALQMAKADVRMRIVDKRARMSADLRAAASATIVERIAASASFTTADAFCSFVPMHEEVQVGALVPLALQRGCKIYLPAYDEAARYYRFREWCADVPLRAGRWNIQEPEGDSFAVPAGKVCIIVPGLAFASSGMRVGYGGGYFDRMLREVRGVAGSCVTAIGVVFAFQVVDSLPYGDHDEPVDFVVTEREMMTIRKQGENT
ncbi:MAG: 5-formyltetrahydrofolate cyclo-ligase [Kiritimatiellia bacterium]